MWPYPWIVLFSPATSTRGNRASESQNPATPISQGNEEVGVIMNVCYSPMEYIISDDKSPVINSVCVGTKWCAVNTFGFYSVIIMHFVHVHVYVHIIIMYTNTPIHVLTHDHTSVPTSIVLVV